MINYALIGCGRIAANHIKAAMANRGELAIAAVCDIIPGRMEAVLHVCDPAETADTTVTAEPAEIKRYTDYKEMLREVRPQFAAIATESGKHAQIALDCLEAGCHVLIEKPIALRTSDALGICQAARRKGLTVGVCHQNRFNPAIQQLRRAYETGRFGNITHATARILWNRNDEYYTKAPWRGTWAMDGGVMMNQCIHNIDLLQWMLGGEAESITAMTRRAMRNIEGEDFGAALVRFKNGAIGIIEGTACLYPKNLEETLSVFGERGTAVIGGLAVNRIQAWQFDQPGPQDAEAAALPAGDPVNVYGGGHTPLYADFIKALLTGTKPLITGEEGMRAMQLVLGAYKSQKEGQCVRLQGLDFSTERMIGYFEQGI